MNLRELVFESKSYYVSDDGRVFDSEMKEFKIQSYTAGYKYVYIKGHNHLIHRLVAQAFLPDYSEDKQVHHKNENKGDNRVENLQVMTVLEHQHMHKQILPVIKICAVCGKEFTPHKTKRRRAVVCSNECKIRLHFIYAAERKRPINQLSLDGTFIRKWDSARDCQNNTGWFESNINKCCNHGINFYKGYKWEYAE